MTGQKQAIEYAGVRLTSESLCGVQGGRVYTVIPHADIRKLTLRYGSPSAHPVIQLVVGGVLAATGIPVVLHLLSWMQHGGMIFTAEAWFLTFPALGLYLVFTALQRGYYLLVEKQKGRMKLSFDSNAKPEGVRALISDARSFSEYPIEIDATVAEPSKLSSP